MPRAIPVPVRQQIWSRVQKGDDALAIAAALRLRPRTVQLLIRRFEEQGAPGLQPSYRATRARVREPLIDEAIALHQGHPSWGAGFIRVRLKMRHPDFSIPSERTLQRWFQRVRLPQAPAGRKPIPERQAACNPHEIWQVDASEYIPLATGQRVSWVRCVDEFSGAVLGTRVFPRGSLAASARRGDTTLLAPAIPPLGAARCSARGQWQTLGKLE